MSAGDSFQSAIEDAQCADGDASAFYRLCRAVTYFIARVMFQFKAFGAKNIPKRGGALLVSNHQSYLDPFLLGLRVGRPMSYLAKSELFTHRLGGWILSRLGAFPVRQGRGDKGAIEETIFRLRQGHMLTVFPEGTRSEDGRIAPLERGVALVVRRSGVPIVPAVISGSFEAWPRERKMPHPHPVRVLYGKPLNVEGLKGDAVIALIERTLKEMLDDLQNGRLKKYEHEQ